MVLTDEEVRFYIGTHQHADPLCLEIYMALANMPGSLQTAFQRVAHEYRLAPDEPPFLYFSHRIAEEVLLRLMRRSLKVLTRLQTIRQYWDFSRRHPYRFLIERGPIFWYTKLRVRSLPKSPASALSWTRYFSFRTTIFLEDKQSQLERIHHSLIMFVGHLAHQRGVLNSMESSRPEFIPWIRELAEFISDFYLYDFYVPETFKRDRQRSSLDLNYAETTSMKELLNNVRLLLELETRLNETLESCMKEHKPPNLLKRNWFGLACVAAGAIFLTERLLFKSPDLLPSIMTRVQELSREFYIEHFWDPMKNLYRRAFHRRSRDQYYASVAELKSSKESLVRMLYDFAITDFNENPDFDFMRATGNEAQKQQYLSVLRKRAQTMDMSIVMRRYEKEISAPIISMARGELLRAVLIQFQKLKVDTESTIVEMDELFEQNDINIQLMATIPAILLLLPIVVVIRQKWTQRLMASTRGHETMRHCISNVQEILICNYGNGFSQLESVKDTGNFLYYLHQVEMVARRERSNHMMSRSELKSLLKDIRLLESLDLDVAQKRLVIQKMYQTHRFLWSSFR